MFSESLWGIVIIGGPIILAAVILWAMANNRRSARQDANSEAATRQLYKDEEAADKTRDAG